MQHIVLGFLFVSSPLGDLVGALWMAIRTTPSSRSWFSFECKNLKFMDVNSGDFSVESGLGTSVLYVGDLVPVHASAHTHNSSLLCPMIPKPKRREERLA